MGEFFEMQQEGLLSWDGEYIGPIPEFDDYNFHCKKCKRGFNTEQGLNDHNRVKHQEKNDV